MTNEIMIGLTGEELDALASLFETITEREDLDALLSVAVKITDALAEQIGRLN